MNPDKAPGSTVMGRSVTGKQSDGVTADAPGVSGQTAVILRMRGMSDVLPLVAPMPERRPYPEHMYIPVPVVTKAVSAFVAVVCVLSLVVSLLTGFTLIHRLFSVLFLIFAVGFYYMGHMLAASSKNAHPTR